MSNLQFFNQIFTSLSFLKIGFLTADAFYIVFAVVVLTQIISMRSIVSEVHSSPLLKAIAILDIVFALSLFLAAFVIL